MYEIVSLLSIVIITLLIIIYNRDITYATETINNNATYETIKFELANLLDVPPSAFTNIKYTIPNNESAIKYEEPNADGADAKVKLEKSINIEFDLLPHNGINKTIIHSKIKKLVADEKFIINLNNSVYRINTFNIDNIPVKYKNINYNTIKKYNVEEFNNFLKSYSFGKPVNSS